MKGVSSSYLWKDRKRNGLGLPWSFTEYVLEEDKLLVGTGVLSKKYEETRLYRIKDFTVKRNLWQRMLGLGSIHICSSDSTTPEIDIENIKNVMQVRDLISNQVEASRKKAGVTASEFIGRGAPAPHYDETEKK